MVHRRGKDVTLITYGSLLDNVLEAAQSLSAEGIEATVLRLLSASHFDPEKIRNNLSEHAAVIVVEEVCSGSGIKEKLAWELGKCCPGIRVDGIDLGADFVTHGSQQKLYESCGLDSKSIAAYTKEVLSHEG